MHSPLLLPFMHLLDSMCESCATSGCFSGLMLRENIIGFVAHICVQYSTMKFNSATKAKSEACPVAECAGRRSRPGSNNQGARGRSAGSTGALTHTVLCLCMLRAVSLRAGECALFREHALMPCAFITSSVEHSVGLRCMLWEVTSMALTGQSIVILSQPPTRSAGAKPHHGTYPLRAVHVRW